MKFLPRPGASRGEGRGEGPAVESCRRCEKKADPEKDRSLATIIRERLLGEPTGVGRRGDKRGPQYTRADPSPQSTPGWRRGEDERLDLHAAWLQSERRRLQSEEDRSLTVINHEA